MENRKEQTVIIKIELDTTDAQKKLDEIAEHIRNSEAFRALNGGVFIKPALIQGAKIGNAIESARPVADTYNINIGKLNVDSIMENALANHEEAERLNDTVRNIAREVIRKECRPGGLLHR